LKFTKLVGDSSAARRERQLDPRPAQEVGVNGGSVCSGCLGLDLGLSRALGIEWAWASETDPACSHIIEREGIPNLGDLFAVDWSAVPRVDLFAAGFPCPDFSTAGKRAGMAGEHGQVWFGVAAAIRALRPAIVVLENVSAITTAPGLDLDAGESALGVVLADLAEVGYVGRWLCLRASDLGAPHRRERLFILATLADADDSRRREVARGTPSDEGPNGWRCAKGDHEPIGIGTSGLRAAVTSHPEGECRPLRTAERERSGRLAGCGALAPDAASISERKPADKAHAESGGGQARSEFGGRSELAWGAYETAIRRWEHAFGHLAPRPTDNQGRLSPEFVEWMQGFPAGWTAGESRTARLRMLGNAVQVQVAEAVGRLLQSPPERTV